MSKYVYDLSKSNDLAKLKHDFNELVTLFDSMDFKKFIGEKCLKELEDIQSYLLSDFYVSEDGNDIHRYRRNHQIRYGNDYIIVFNDTTLEQADMTWVSEKTRANYPDGISVAYIVEYGTGIRGTSQDDWQVDINNHGTQGWVYKNPITGKFTQTIGIEGKFIYQKLLDRVEKNFDKWVSEYFEKYCRKEGWL